MAYKVKTESAGDYYFTEKTTTKEYIDLDKVELSLLISTTLNKIKDKFKTELINSPELASQYLSIKYSQEEREIFGVIWLNQKLNFISIEELFFGTVNQADVHIREVLKSGLKANAASCVLFHNHPSGNTNPSQADIDITKKLKDYLNEVKITLRDHIIVGGGTFYSFAREDIL